MYAMQFYRAYEHLYKRYEKMRFQCITCQIVCMQNVHAKRVAIVIFNLLIFFMHALLSFKSNQPVLRHIKIASWQLLTNQYITQ